MRFLIVLILISSITCPSAAQDTYTVSGNIANLRTKEFILGAVVFLEGSPFSSSSGTDGAFELNRLKKGDYILQISVLDFSTKRIPFLIENESVSLGTIYMEPDIAKDKADNLITLTDADLSDDEGTSITSGLLQATRDIFLRRAAFDFGQAFFRVRGYDAQNGKVLLNGIPMNTFFNGRPQWNHWGGLNDVTRNQQFTNGVGASEYTFGGILGNTNIDLRPSGLRPGIRLSSSFSNRTYAGRLMATYTSGPQKNDINFSVSGSRRWAKQGYIDGTLYDAFSFFGALEYEFNKRNSIVLTGILASNRRGRSSAITEEVYNVLGKRYNPYWGIQEGGIRNSRERKILEPVALVNHFYESSNFRLNTGIAYQTGTNQRSRLGYYNAPNPDPTYYGYLPSFYINSPIGANFISANLSIEGLLENPQLDWTNVYRANAREKAAYVLYNDVANTNTLSINTIGNLTWNEHLQIDFGAVYQRSSSENFAEITDLLGADFHEDLDPFSNTLNDVNGDINKIEGDIFNYNYKTVASGLNAFAQLEINYSQWHAFVAASLNSTTYQREGLFRNGRFLENSLGAGEPLEFLDYGIKGGFSYKITGRHWLNVNGAFIHRPPTLQNTFINPRENNEVVPDIQSERIATVDLNYFIRLPQLTARVTGFYSRFQNITDINFFFVDAGVGSDFVQEVLTDLDKLHMGTEIGLEYELSSSVKLSAVAAIGRYVYASNPNVTINFDTAAADEDLINLEGNIDLGMARLKDHRLAQGPQNAYALGLEYRDPKYWWVGATANYLANNYANISTITRTASFALDPDIGMAFPDATSENINRLLAQKPLENFYLLNVVGGKSWLRKGTYISVFASVNNVFDAVFRTGGYEQSRNGNFGQLQQDNLSGNPSFAPKYWYGYGRTYFLNLAYSF